MQSLWLCANMKNGELLLLAATPPQFLMSGQRLSAGMVELRPDDTLFPLGPDFYKVRTNSDLLMLLELGKLGPGDSYGRHAEARASAFDALPELVDAVKNGSLVFMRPKTLEFFEDETLHTVRIKDLLRAYLLGIQDGEV